MSDTTPIPLLDLKAQYATIREPVQQAMQRVAEAQAFIMGAEVEGLEQEVATYCQCKHGIGVSSGTDALLVALMAMNVGNGDEVITTPFTFFATAGSIVRTGATPVFVDIDPVTFNLDVSKVQDAITSRTKAIMPIHLYGQMAEMSPLLDLAEKHGVRIIEDAAQAIGAECHGRRAGSMGDAGCLSFFPSKNLGGFGDGGMVVTNDDAVAERIRLMRNHGMQPKYYYSCVGGNFRLDALQAAVLRIKLQRLDEWTEGRQKNAALYRRLFEEEGLVGEAGQCAGRPDEVSGVVLPHENADSRHVYNQFVIRVPNRDRVREILAEKGVGHDVYYPVPLHLQECFANLGHAPGSFPVSECAADHVLAIPIYPELKEEQIRQVVLSIRDALAASKQ